MSREKVWAMFSIGLSSLSTAAKLIKGIIDLFSDPVDREQAEMQARAVWAQLVTDYETLDERQARRQKELDDAVGK